MYLLFAHFDYAPVSILEGKWSWDCMHCCQLRETKALRVKLKSNPFYCFYFFLSLKWQFQKIQLAFTLCADLFFSPYIIAIMIC